MKIYLNVCCLNRPFDDQSQARIRLEAEAILAIVPHLHSGEWERVSSDATDLEIDRTSDRERRKRVRLLAPRVTTYIRVGSEHLMRASELRALGFRDADALHLACAEAAAADIFLTTDDGLMRRAIREARNLHMRVANPLSWITEALSDGV